MTMYEIIMKKRNGGALNEEEIRYAKTPPQLQPLIRFSDILA